MVADNAGKHLDSRLSIVAAIGDICNSRDLKAASRAASALGFLAAGDRSQAMLDAASQKLLQLSSKKGDELQFSVGEALCFAFQGGLSLANCKT